MFYTFKTAAYNQDRLICPALLSSFLSPVTQWWIRCFDGDTVFFISVKNFVGNDGLKLL